MFVRNFDPIPSQVLYLHSKGSTSWFAFAEKELVALLRF